MMERTRIARKRTDSPRAVVWHCKGCEVVHLSVDGSVIDLSNEDFRQLASSVVETTYEMATVNLTELPVHPPNSFLH